MATSGQGICNVHGFKSPYSRLYSQAIRWVGSLHTKSGPFPLYNYGDFRTCMNALADWIVKLVQSSIDSVQNAAPLIKQTVIIVTVDVSLSGGFFRIHRTPWLWPCYSTIYVSACNTCLLMAPY